MLLPIASQIAMDAMKRQWEPQRDARVPGETRTSAPAVRPARRRVACVRRGLAHALRAVAQRVDAPSRA